MPHFNGALYAIFNLLYNKFIFILHFKRIVSQKIQYEHFCRMFLVYNKHNHLNYNIYEFISYILL